MGVALRLAVEHPEGNIDPLDLLHMIFLGEAFGQEKFSLVVFLERFYGILFAGLEWNDEIRTQYAGKLTRHHRRVSAVGTGCGCRGFIADKLRAAAGAAVSPHPLPLRSPVLAETRGIPYSSINGRCAMVLLCFFRCLLGCRRLFLFLCVKRLDFRCFVAGTAVVALQFPGFSHKVERASASRALIVGDLCWHLIPSFPVPGDSSIKACNTPVNPNGSRPLWGGSHAYRFSLLGHQATEKILLPPLNGSVTGTSCC